MKTMRRNYWWDEKLEATWGRWRPRMRKSCRVPMKAEVVESWRKRGNQAQSWAKRKERHVVNL